MSLATHVRTLGRGPGRSMSLTQDEAFDAMSAMLSSEAEPEAVGALLMLLRMKGEIAAEIAGLAEAAQTLMPLVEGVDLDWPSYASGRSRGLPWFLLAAQLVALTDARVLIHGWNGPDTKVRAGLSAAGITMAQSPEDASRLLDRDGIAYLPLEKAHPRLMALLRLREKLGLRSCINTVCRMLNPGRAPASVQGVFHPSYQQLQSEAAELLGWQALSVLKGGGGEFERMPSKDLAAIGLRDNLPWRDRYPVLVEETRRSNVDTGASLAGVWSGAEAPAFELNAVLGTASIALETLGASNGMARAQALWSTRTPKRYAS